MIYNSKLLLARTNMLKEYKDISSLSRIRIHIFGIAASLVNV